MGVLLAKHSGFCYGVKNAVEMAQNALLQGTLYSCGALIHNSNVVEKLKHDGLKQVDSISEIPSGETVIIRAHGAPRSTFSLIAQNNIKAIDATCPHVKKIHRIVDKYCYNGYDIIIIGDKNHPEVIGTNGWCNNSALIFPDTGFDEGEIDELDENGNYCVVAQTTIDVENWNRIVELLRNKIKNIAVHNTICNTTMLRQKEAVSMAAKVDCMIVLGSKKSSNTKKLVEICAKTCYNTIHVENVRDLPEINFKQFTVGVTTGASTPEWIIKEVVHMSEEINIETATELNFAEELEKSVVTLKSGDTVKGTVISITPTEVFVDLGVKADGAIPLGELTDDPIQSPNDIVSIGDVIDVFVVRVNDVEGTITLSKKKLDSMAGWRKAEQAYENQEILTGKVVEILKGGLIVSSNNARVFIPASQASERFLQDLGILLNETVSFRIIDINQKRRKLVGSIKVVANEIKKIKYDEFWASAEVGKFYEGVVKSITPFGVFVDLGGIDGLVHISELSWTRVKHPTEVVAVGDKIKVFIIALDKEKNKISLGYRLLEDSPWHTAQKQIKAGDVIDAKIVRLVPFGAFAEIMPHIDGLIHISQISDTRIAKPSDVLSVGQEVKAKVMEVDFENKKIALSLKALINESENVD